MLSKGTRVGFSGSTGTPLQSGTVVKASPAGYVQVRWDAGGVGYFSPMSAFKLRPLDGDAHRRHVWVDHAPLTLCRYCQALQTEDNIFEACLEESRT